MRLTPTRKPRVYRITDVPTGATNAQVEASLRRHFETKGTVYPNLTVKRGRKHRSNYYAFI